MDKYYFKEPYESIEQMLEWYEEYATPNMMSSVGNALSLAKKHKEYENETNYTIYTEFLEKVITMKLLSWLV